MRLYFVLLVINWCVPTAKPFPAGRPNWKQSRYIIDNRRNILFKKPFVEMYSKAVPVRPSYYATSPDTAGKQHSTTEKDLNAESTIDNTYFRKFVGNLNNDVNSDHVFKYELTDYLNPKNVSVLRDYDTSAVFTPSAADFFGDRLDNDLTTEKSVVDVTESQVRWTPNQSSQEYPSIVTVQTTAKTVRDDATERPLERVSAAESLLSSTTSFPWKSEEGNLIYRDSEPSEKHVYETRIETVSYHQEVIFAQPKTVKRDGWVGDNEGRRYRGSDSVPVPNEQSYEPVEENYEQPERNYEEEEKNYEEPEKNYEKEEVGYEGEWRYQAEGKMVRIPAATDEGDDGNNSKFGYVVDGKNFRKYRVEERTVDGFIVGEYGVVSHNDGSLRGVRYTADGSTNPQLIYEALVKFLSL